MPLSNRNFRLLTHSIGALLALMGSGLLAVFLVYLATGVSPLAGTPIGDGLGLLVLATIGAFALPVGLSLWSRSSPASANLRIAAFALGLMAVLRLAAMLSPDIRAAAGLTPLIEFFVLGGIAALALWVRPEDEAAIEITTTIDIDAPAAAAWNVLAERFDEVATFSRGLESSMLDRPVGIGATRTCETKPFGPFAAARLTEELVEFSPAAMRFSYVAGGELPAFIPGSKNRWSIQAMGPGQCRAISHASIELLWWAVPFAPFLGWTIRSEVGRFGEDLRNRVENGPALAHGVVARAG